jgi:hypothetical protein
MFLSHVVRNARQARRLMDQMGHSFAELVVISVVDQNARSRVLDEPRVWDAFVADNRKPGSEIVVDLTALVVLDLSLSQDQPNLRIYLPCPILIAVNRAKVTYRLGIQLIRVTIT